MRNEKGTRLTLVDANGTYEVFVPEVDLTLPEVIDRLVMGVLLAAGYHETTVSEALKGDI